MRGVREPEGVMYQKLNLSPAVSFDATASKDASREAGDEWALARGTYSVERVEGTIEGPLYRSNAVIARFVGNSVALLDVPGAGACENGCFFMWENSGLRFLMARATSL